MTKTNEKVVSILNELIALCKDGEQGFQDAAEGLKNPELKALCLQYSRQRAQFAQELRDEVRQLGDEPTSMGTVKGALHRGWLNIRAAVSGGEEDSIVAECERGEDEAKDAYEKAVNEYLPPNIAGLVQKQYLQVKEAHDRFSAMQKAAK